MKPTLTHDAHGSRIAEDLYRVSVPNHVGPSGQPTNVYIVGRSPAILIDVGSDDGGVTVMEALERFGIGEVSRIVLTHAHPDHAGNAAALQLATGASIELHRRDAELSNRLPFALQVDNYLEDEHRISVGQYTFEVIETPGHAPGHVSLFEPSLRALFAGDLMSGNGTVAVVPPRGSMGDYLRSLRRVATLPIDIVYPGHGPEIENGGERVRQYIEHRQRREEAIYDQIAMGHDTVASIMDALYADVLPRIRPQAAGTVLAHVIHLIEESRVQSTESNVDLMSAHFVALSES